MWCSLTSIKFALFPRKSHVALFHTVLFSRWRTEDVLHGWFNFELLRTPTINGLSRFHSPNYFSCSRLSKHPLSILKSDNFFAIIFLKNTSTLQSYSISQLSSNIHLAQKHMLLSHTRTVTVVMSFHIDIEISRLRISNPKEYHSSTKLKFIARISRRSILSQQLKY